MEAVIFVGLQGAGKSTFFQQRFAATHVRISLDQLKTRARERAVLRECLEAGRDLVVDNTNSTLEERARYIVPARAARFKIIGHYFAAPIADCLRRNAERAGKGRVPNVALFATLKKMKLPESGEGFDELFFVATESDHEFRVTPWAEAPWREYPRMQWPVRKHGS